MSHFRRRRLDYCTYASFSWHTRTFFFGIIKIQKQRRRKKKGFLFLFLSRFPLNLTYLVYLLKPYTVRRRKLINPHSTPRLRWGPSAIQPIIAFPSPPSHVTCPQHRCRLTTWLVQSPPPHLSTPSCNDNETRLGFDGAESCLAAVCMYCVYNTYGTRRGEEGGGFLVPVYRYLWKCIASMYVLYSPLLHSKLCHVRYYSCNLTYLEQCCYIVDYSLVGVCEYVPVL